MSDNQNSLTVGPRAPVVFEDFLLFEKMAHFNSRLSPSGAGLEVAYSRASGGGNSFLPLFFSSPLLPQGCSGRQRLGIFRPTEPATVITSYWL